MPVTGDQEKALAECGDKNGEQAGVLDLVRTQPAACGQTHGQYQTGDERDGREKAVCGKADGAEFEQTRVHKGMVQNATVMPERLFRREMKRVLEFVVMHAVDNVNLHRAGEARQFAGAGARHDSDR